MSTPETNDDDDRVLRQLRGLPERKPDDIARTRIHHRARALFARATRDDDRWLARFDRWYARLEPILAVGTSVVYLAYAVKLLSEVLR
jgi:hypothetical protein